MNQSKQLAQVGPECVACGCCVAVCPRKAIGVIGGVAARVDSARCVGCARCERACPAGVIAMIQREEESA